MSSVDSTVSLDVKKEPYSPSPRPRSRRLRSPVFIKDEINDMKPKRSRLSSPVMLDGDGSRGSTCRENRDRRYKSERSPRNRLSPNRGRALSRFGNSNPIQWGRPEEERKKPETIKSKEQPNFEVSGKLAADTNAYKGVVIKYNEPDDARKPNAFWRLHPFKGEEALKIMHVHRQSGYLIGKDSNIADIPMLHPSISKQHAVLQFRFTNGKVRPYIIDLESTNGTFLNCEKIEPRRFYELRVKDVLKFGYSSREYVVMLNEEGFGSENE